MNPAPADEFGTKWGLRLNGLLTAGEAQVVDTPELDSSDQNWVTRRIIMEDIVQERQGRLRQKRAREAQLEDDKVMTELLTSGRDLVRQRASSPSSASTMVWPPTWGIADSSSLMVTMNEVLVNGVAVPVEHPVQVPCGRVRLEMQLEVNVKPEHEQQGDK